MKKKIEELIKHYDGEIYDLCYLLISDFPDFREYFQYVCENIDLENEEKTVPIKKYFEKSEIEVLKKINADAIDGLIAKNISKVNYGIVNNDDFYGTLWDDISNNFTGTKELAFALYWIIIDRRIPYIYIGVPLSMENDEFKTRTEANKDVFDKMEYVLQSEYSQRTEEASMLLKVLEDIENYEDRVVVFTHMILCLRESNLKNHRILDLVKKLSEKMQEDD